jgi:RNA polymerase subunit RPABC4/transcription elongation factor Spt4
MYCKNCGAQLDTKSKFCGKCGSPTKTESTKNKYCPFCKNSIPENTVKCPHCGRVLFERIESQQTPASSAVQSAKPSTDKRSDNFLKQLVDKIHRWFKREKIRKVYASSLFWPIVIVIIVIIITSAAGGGATSNNPPVSALPNNNEGSPTIPTPTPPPPAPATYTSLPNGTILSRNTGYLDGLGQLTIGNGTGQDAIAKLVDAATNRSVFTVYVAANSNYTIDKITDGDYKLFFNLGNNWDANVKAFTENSSYSVFEDDFNFATTNTQYQTFSVTLNSVAGGTAQTDDVDASQFGSY